MWETQVRSLGREDPLETEMATHSSILAWRIPWTEEPGRLQSMGSQRVGHDWATSQTLNNWCFWTVVLENTLESPLDSKEFKPGNPKLNQSWIFIGRTAVETEGPTLWSLDAQSWFVGKGPDAGKDWGQKEKEITENEMTGWHHQLNGHEFEQTSGDS